MPNQKVPQLPILTAITDADLFYVVDVSDTTDDPTGSSKQVTREEILTNVSHIDFNLTAVTSHEEGRVSWNDSIKSLEIDTENPNVQVQVGHQEIQRVNNQSGSILTKGTVVYINGEQGQRPTIVKADYSADTSSASVIGLVAADINDGANGYILTSGILEGLNTAAYSAGTPLYLFTGGTYSSDKPQAPNHDVRIGKVIVSNATTGSIYVNLQNGYELDELHDVRITSASIDEVLVRSSYNGIPVWVNTNVLSGLSYMFAATVVGTTVVGTTISASTYQNLPIDINVTGGTYDSSTGTATLTNNTGGTFNITGFFKPSDDVYVTGATYSNGELIFTNKTGGTFSVVTSTNYSAGVISGATYTSAGSGQINLPAIKVALYNNANNIEPIIVYDVASGTTGSGGIPSLVDQDTNYIVVEYNGGSPRYYVYDNDGPVNDSSVVLFMIVYRLGNFVHTLEFGNQGAGLANKLNDRFVMTNRFGWESGLSLGLSGTTGVVTVTEGVAWNASYRQSLTAVNSQDDIFFKNYHSGGVWTYTTTGDTLNNTYYDNGTDIVTATDGKYLVNWYFRGQEVNDHLYEVYGNDEYDSVAEAELSVEPLLPELITSHAFLLGRIIVLKSQTTGVTQSAFVKVFQSTQVDSHNDLLNIQGGGPGEYYHLTSSQYNNLPYKNSGNTFTQLQTFSSGLTATTVSGGTVTSSGDVTAAGVLKSTQSVNDEGGEVQLSTPQTNTTLSGGSVNIDIYQNRIRIFEAGGSNRGAYIDITQANTGVGSDLLNPTVTVSFNYGLANAIMTGTFLT